MVPANRNMTPEELYTNQPQFDAVDSEKNQWTKKKENWVLNWRAGTAEFSPEALGSWEYSACNSMEELQHMMGMKGKLK